MKNRTVKYIFIILGALAVTYTLLVYIYFAKNLRTIVVEQINRSVNAKIDVKKIDISAWQSFPKVSVLFKDAVVYTSEADTLAFFQDIGFEFNVIDLLQKKYKITSILLKDGLIRAKDSNYLIFKQYPKTSSPIGIYLNHIKIKNVSVLYTAVNESQKYALYFKDFDIGGYLSQAVTEGIFSGEVLVNQLKINDIDYLEKEALDLKIHFKKTEKIFRLSESSIQTNKLNFNVKGSIDLDNNHIDVVLQDKKADIQALVDKLPDYISQYKKVYEINGLLNYKIQIKGVVDKRTVPNIHADFLINQGKIRNRENHIQLENFFLKGYFDNGRHQNAKTSQLFIEEITGLFNQDTLRASFSIYDFTYPYVQMSIEARGNPTHFIEFFSLDSLINMEGNYQLRFKAKGKFKDLSSPSKQEIIRASTQGFIQLTDAWAQWKDYTLTNLKSQIYFSGNSLIIQELSGKVNSTIFKTKGKLDNFLGRIFLAQPAKMQGIFTSPCLKLDNLLASNSQNENISPQLRLPDLISYNLSVKADTFVFDRFLSLANNLNFYMDSSKILISNLKGNFFEGQHQLSAVIRPLDKENFQAKVSVSATDASISQLFYQTYNFGQNFITHNHLSGRLSYSVIVKGQFSNTFQIDTTSIQAGVQTTIYQGILKDFVPLQEVAEQIQSNKILRKIVDVEKLKSELQLLQFQQITNTFKIENSKVIIPEMKITANNFDLKIRGNHHFNNKFAYTMQLYFSDLLMKNKNEKKFPIEIRLKGYPDDFDVKITPKIKETIQQEVEQEKQEVKSALKEEFNLFQKDTTINTYQPVKKVDYQIYWEEAQDSAASRNIKEENKKTKKSLFKSNKPKKTNSDDFFQEEDDF